MENNNEPWIPEPEVVPALREWLRREQENFDCALWEIEMNEPP